ncbi:MAG: PQQ-dependent sugar dehydrogenase, partial [Gammaproteobacteria bacterium]|nr:PQQ-dependent sugar dehydrogenase [Gammaproteobacteria bacterium]
MIATLRKLVVPRPRAAAMLATAALYAIATMPAHADAAPESGCPAAAGLTLPPGFCATVFADQVGHARHLAVAASGVVYVNTWGARDYGFGSSPSGGYLVALEDTTGKGVADVVRRFGPAKGQGGHGGTGIALYKGALYVEESDRIERYALGAGAIVPQGEPEVIVSGLPLGGDHPMHPFVIDVDGMLYVDVASATNSCQERNRQPRVPGMSPCTELETRGGIWRYDANRTAQKFSPADRYATGIRNADGIAVDASGRGIWATQHGRDQLYQNWPKLYRPEDEATQPAEELLKVKEGGDYGWPECYFDEVQGKLVLAPEYGGDGGKAVGVCAQKLPPVASFPAHWAPNDVVIYTASGFPEHYRNGAFIAFHGSWDRAPYPQGGYNIVFQALTGEAATGRCEVFADGFAGAVKQPDSAAHRPSGVAVGPDGALYVADDAHGRIYRIAYRGAGGTSAGAAATPCPPPDAPAGSAGSASALPPEGVHANAGARANLPVPPGSSRQMLELGDQVFHGRAGGGTCVACHGAEGRGTNMGPPLTATKSWLWSDGSYAGITKVVRDGVPAPKQFREPMPPMGGAQLTPEQTSAVAAYVWAL